MIIIQRTPDLLYEIRVDDLIIKCDDATSNQIRRSFESAQSSGKDMFEIFKDTKKAGAIAHEHAINIFVARCKAVLSYRAKHVKNMQAVCTALFYDLEHQQIFDSVNWGAL